MADPAQASGVASMMQGPLGPWVAILLAPAIAAGWGADQAVERAGATRGAIEAAIAEQIRPVRAEQADAASERRRNARALAELREDVRSIATALRPGRATIPGPLPEVVP